MKSLLVVVTSVLTSSLVAQGDQETVDEQYRTADRALQNTSAEVESLIDLRMRHDLGLVAELDDRLVRVENPATPREMATQRRELSELTKSTDYFRGEYEKLRAKVKLLNDAATAAGNRADVGEMIPPTGSSRPRQITKASNPTPETMPAAPGVEMATSTVERADLGALALDPLRAQIHGSKDHLRVAQALFKVGQALMDRGEELRKQGRIEVARELDDRAKARLERAIKELDPLMAEQEPAYVVLFYLGRCRELMFRYSEHHENLSLAAVPTEYSKRRASVREPFLQISARDVKKIGAAGGVEVLGSWGQAAKTAMEHFRWMNTNATYDATNRIKALTWPGEDRQ